MSIGIIFGYLVSRVSKNGSEATLHSKAGSQAGVLTNTDPQNDGVYSLPL